MPAARQIYRGRSLRRLAVSVRTVFFRRDRDGSLDLGSSSLRREQGIKAYREQHGSRGISRLYLPPPPVRDLGNTVLNHFSDRFSGKSARLIYVGHLDPFSVENGLVRA